MGSSEGARVATEFQSTKGISAIEGKVTRVGASECEQRGSFKGISKIEDAAIGNAADGTSDMAGAAAR
jgi:hypothetical protein